MKKICLIFNHFQFQDGVCRSAIAMANLFADRDDVDVTLLSVYKFEKDTTEFLCSKIKVKNIFGFYFRGFNMLVKHIPASWLYKKYMRGRYDVEIAFQYGISYRILTACKKPEAVRRIGWIHGYDNTLKAYYLKMDQMVCVSKCNADKAFTDLGGKVPVTYNYNPIDDNKVRESGKEAILLKRKEDIIQFVTVGRLSPEKGYGRLLSIMARLKKEGYSYGLWILGSGPLYKSLKNQISNLRLEDSITLVGAQKNPHAYTSKADVFICSSFSEGYSTACTEAVMLGIPVVTTNVSGGKEIIEDAECGLLTEIDDESLYQGIKQVLDNHDIIQQWKDTLVRTREKFSAKVRFEQMKKILGLQ